MTTPCLPDYILVLFQNELKPIILKVVENMCLEYKIDLDDAKIKLKDSLNINFEITNIDKIKITKKQKEHSADIRCIARIYKAHDIEIVQCTRKKGNDCEYCKKHNIMNEENRLKYGNINEPLDDFISESVLSKKKKNSII